MNDELKKAIKKSQADSQESFTKERNAFKTLLLSNPNFFGNLIESTFKPVLSLCCNTHYEELVCVGYHPQQEQLEGVVHVYQPSGYGTNICGPGSSEFVRFYLSFDNGVTWQDQGMTSFQAYNIPEGTDGSKRMEYGVSLKVDPQRRWCLFERLIQVRAILSWNNPPPANQPNWRPVWGNVNEASILVEPRRLIFIPELFEVAKAKLPPEFKKTLDLEVPIKTPAKALGAAELAPLYRNKGIPTHRFAFKEIMQFVSGQTLVSAESLSTMLPDIKIDPDIGDILFPKKDGDTSFEELTCVGLDPNTPDSLVGVIHVKKTNGYSGGTCSDGSREYVTFWADFDDNGSFETCLGTADVRVYDLNSLPPSGVQYAVRLPVDLNTYRQVCQKGPKLVRIRAILSWNVPAPCTNPNHVPTWGNREETLIHVGASAAVPAGKIAILGGIPVSMINNTSGLTTADAVFATNNLPPDDFGRPCPFAARVASQGTPIPGYSYKVEVKPAFGGVWSPVLNDLTVTDSVGATTTHSADSVTQRFDYLPFNQNVNSLLAQWDSSGNDKWWVRLTSYDGGGTQVGTDIHAVQLDNTWPDASIDITTGTGNCGKFASGTPLAGNFVARDDYLARYTLRVEPNVNDPGEAIPVPDSGLVNTALVPGDGWTLDTTGMISCGYVIRVTVVDRAIVNSESVGHYISDSAGFCLDEIPES